MTIAVVTLAILAAILGGGLVASTAWARGETKASARLAGEKLAVERKCLDLEDERDAALGRAVKAETERDKVAASVKVFQEAARAAREELTKHVREKLAAGSDDDVAAEVDRLLMAVPKAGRTPTVSGLPSAAPGDGGGDA